MASKDQRTYKRQEESKNQKSDNRDIIRKIMSEESSDIQVKNTQKKGEPSRNQSNFKEQQDQEQKRRDNKLQPSSQRTASSGNQQREDSSKKIHQGQHSSGYDLQQGTGTCFNHGKPFSDYCESCEEPCCEDCKNFGHRVVPISEAYRKRMSQMYSMMNTHLYQKKETLIQQVKKREQLIEEVKNASLSIERELRAEFSGMIERLNAQAGQKLALLQYDKDELQSDVNRIQEIAIQIDQSSSDHLQFLMKSKNIMDSMESAHAKPYRTEIKVTVDDLPKELFQTKELVQQCALYKELNATKDELI